MICTNKQFSQRNLPVNKLEFDQYFSKEIKLVALFEESVKYRLIEEYGIDSFTYTKDNKLLLKVDFTNKDNLISWILSFGDTVEVLEPKEICKDIRNHSLNMIKKYKET